MGCRPANPPPPPAVLNPTLGADCFSIFLSDVDISVRPPADPGVLPPQVHIVLVFDLVPRGGVMIAAAWIKSLYYK